MYQIRNSELVILALYTSDYKREIYLREIARLAPLPLKTTQNAVGAIEQKHILKSQVHGRNKYFSLNLQNIQTKLALVQAEVYKTMLFVETHSSFAFFMKENRSSSPLILFGSIAKGTAHKGSDVDFLSISEKTEYLPFHLLPSKVHIVRLAEQAFRSSLEKGEALLKEIDSNHIILNGHSWYVHMLWSFNE